MFLSSWRMLVNLTRRNGKTPWRKARKSHEGRKSRWLWVELLEERVVPTHSKFLWNGSGDGSTWTSGGNWSGVGSFVGTYPGESGTQDIAQFVQGGLGFPAGPQFVVVTSPLSIGEIKAALD